MTGILLLQLGTPDAPTAKGLRPYLKQFLADPRVIETKPAVRNYLTPGLNRKARSAPPQFVWDLVLNGIIVPFRSPDSAKKYRRIWSDDTGSPLLHYTQRQTALLQERFPNALVRYGMTYGNPSVETAVTEMVAAGVDRIIAVPMYPQYSATTTAASTDAFFKVLMRLRVVPAVRTVPPHYLHPAYLDAMVASVHDDLAKLGWEPDHFLFSFHGIPRKYVQRGDPYATHCVRTTLALVERFGFQKKQWSRSFQSRLGREPWLTPYTDDTVEHLAKQGVKKLAVILPGFTADCLETVDEIGNEAGEEFHEAGGEKLRSVPCLNDHPKWIDALETMVREEGAGWV
ncbi:MAG: ferrochelatase [Fimbriiglobus sp.]|jgi:ferrochelatase|nr:ferrochelatase [Fimbriiglobus sp.]